MPDKVERILESIKINATSGVYEDITTACGVLEEKASPNRQAKYVKSIISRLEETAGAEVVAKVMKPCGHQCISSSTIEKARLLYRRSQNIEEFLKLLNESHIGGGKLRIEKGIIIGEYDRCYCGLVKNVKGISPHYCNCSAGWFEKLFSFALEREVEVRKKKTILEGFDYCIFEII